MGTTATSVLEKRLGEQIGDHREVIVTTAIAATNLIVSTNLTSFDGGSNSYYVDWWVYITDYANITVQRQVSAYTSSTGTLTVRGAALTTDGASLATIRLHRYNRDLYINAINDACREIYPSLARLLEDRSMVTGNILPDNSFEQWSSATAMTFYSASNATLARTSTAGLTRGALATYSKKVTVSAGSGYSYISSNTYPRLLQLMGKTITFKCWAYPEVADDATIVIYTIKADGTAQTLTSTTTCPATKWTLLELEDQAINDDIVEIQFRFKVTTNAKYTYFDSARVTGITNYEYLLISCFVDGAVNQVYVQTSGDADDACDDLYVANWERVFGYLVLNDGNYSYLQLPYAYSSKRQIRVIGSTTLETVSAYTDTISVDGSQLNLFIAYAKYKLWQAIESPVSSQDTRRYESQSARAYGEYMRLRPRLSTSLPSGTLKLPVY